MQSLPAYRIEPPDILMINAIHVVPRPPYRLRTLDVLAIDVPGALPDAPIDGVYPVALGGVVNFGMPYGAVQVEGMTVEEAQQAIGEYLRKYLREPTVSVRLVNIAAKQHIAGEHLVSPDGTVTLGSYGSVPVARLTVAQAKRVVEKHLSQFLQAPEVSLRVAAYNSKVYYVITEATDLGDNVVRLPIMGNETVLDAISNVGGLSQLSSRKIWVARPAPLGSGKETILPVDWEAITRRGATATNYQIFPRDRVFIAEKTKVQSP